MVDSIGMQLNARQLGDALDELVRDLSAGLETPPDRDQLLAMRDVAMRALSRLDALNRDIKHIAKIDGTEM